jgi:hypothetical protein
MTSEEKGVDREIGVPRTAARGDGAVGPTSKRGSSTARPGAACKSKGARLKSEAAATEATAKARDASLRMTTISGAVMTLLLRSEKESWIPRV